MNWKYDTKLIGKRIHERRKQKKMSLHTLADISDVSSSFLSGIENGSKRMSINVLGRLCQALDTSPNHILMYSTDEQAPRLDDIPWEFMALINKFNSLHDSNSKASVLLLCKAAVGMLHQEDL